MPQPVVTLPAHVSAAGSPGTAFVSANTRVKAATGPLGILTDVMSFGGPLVTGAWVLGNTRVKAGGIPTVGMGSTGLATGAAGATGPVTVVMGDMRVGAT
jgi:hypothetical protein